MAGENGKRKKRSRKARPDNPAQSKRFIEAAKALGADQGGEAFDQALSDLLKAKPKPKGGSN